MTTRAQDRPAVAMEPPSGPARRRLRLPRLGPLPTWFLGVWLAAFVLLMLNDPGKATFDTKLGVELAPSQYFAGLWQLWNPRFLMGTLNNQAIGYAVPMAPFYLAGHALHLPLMATERAWMSLLLAIGFAGLVKLADTLGIGSAPSRYLGGLVFALWPTFTIVLGSTSAAALPGLLAPWAVLPLARAVRGHGGVLTAAARSGLAVLCMGGVNATSTIDVLLLPGLFILTYARGRRLAGLAVAWTVAVVLATAWWALPLLLQGKYAFNFLPYVEQANTTTSTASAAATLRGAGDWVAYFNLGSPWLPAGWALVTIPFAVLTGSAATAIGLYGLCSRGMPGARWLRLAAGIAAAVALAGYNGPLGGPFALTVQRWLDGTLAPFRSVYKLEPVIAAVLALGVAHAMRHWLTTAGSRRSHAFVTTARLATAIVLCGLALPFLAGRMLNPGPFTAVPGYWSQVASYLAAHSPRNTALVVPADAHGAFVWGNSVDDPLQALARSPWAARDLVPYGGAGSQILLDTAEKAIESGERVTGLAAYLERAGVRYLVVRNDMDPQQVGYTSPVVVHQSIALSGFIRAAAFGPQITGAQYAPDAAPQQQAALPGYPAVEVYAAGAAGALSPVTALPLSDTALVNGGPDALLQLLSQRALPTAQPAVIAGDPLPAAPAAWDVTDGQRRADNLFGLTDANASYTYTATEDNPADDQLGGAGQPPRQLLPVAAAGHQTVAVLSGAAAVTVSSYGSWLDDTQQDDPANAFDANPATAWAEGSASTPVGQWIQIAFDHQLDLPASAGIRLLDDSPAREIASRLVVTTAAGRAVTQVSATGAVQRLNLPPGRTTWLRITFAAAYAIRGAPGAGISDVLIPGVRVTRLLEPAQDPAGQRAASVSFSFRQQVPSPITFAAPAAVPPMARTFSVAGPTGLRLRASALAVPGPGLDALLDKIAQPGPGVLQVSVASTPASLGTQFPIGLVSGSGGGLPWTAGTANPVIHLSWQGKRAISSLVVEPAAGDSVPLTVKVTSPDGTRSADAGFGIVTFDPPLVTDRIDVSFPQVQLVTSTSASGQTVTLPLGLSRLYVPALAGLRVAVPDPSATFTLACGSGPGITVDGLTYPTSVSGTIGELTGFLPVQVRPCAPDVVTLTAGRHTLTTPVTGTFTVTDVRLTAGPAASAGSGRTTTVRSWQADQREVQIGPGSASYLEVHENYDSGWQATLAGQALRPVRLDGWQQAFVVPAGAGGMIKLTFRPAALYHKALIASLIAVALLLLLALRPWRRRRPAPPQAMASSRSSGPGSLGWVAGVAGTGGVLFVAGGAVAGATAVIAVLAWWVPRALPALALTAMAGAGIFSATAAGTGTFGGPAQACALIALAAVLVPAANPARTGQRGSVSREFGVVDELSCYFDSRAEPNNVHMELRLTGHLDPERLRGAISAVLAREPRAGAKRAAGSRWRRHYAWEYQVHPDREPLTLATWHLDAELATARSRFLATAPPLDFSPPFRLLLARGPGQDCLILNAHHAAFDGLSCLQLLRMIGARYGGWGAEQQVVLPKSEQAPAARQPATGLHRSAQIASQGQTGGWLRGAAGYGFHLLTWPDVPVPPQSGALRATVNDLLVAALIETIGLWNAARDQPELPVRISVPVDARPPGHEAELGNLSRLCTVSAMPGEELITAAVAAQTRRAKDETGPQVGAGLTAMAELPLPAVVKRRLVRAAAHGLGSLASDTSLVSNLGNVTDPPLFGGMPPFAMWFSTSAHMPRGLSVGAITIDGRLHLCFRYRYALLDFAAADEFARLYRQTLERLRLKLSEGRAP